MNGQIKEAQHTQQVLQRKSVFLVWLFSFLTLGIYAAFWYIKRKPEFDNLNTQKKLNKRLAIIYLIFVIIIVVYQILTIFFMDALQQSTIVGIILPIVGITVLVLHLILAFNTRTILNEVWASKGITRKVSWFFTLIFSLFYLQYEINRTIDNKESEKRTGPWVCFILLIILPIILVGIVWIIIIGIMEEGISNLNVP